MDAPHTEWTDRLAALRAYIAERGSFPSASKPGQKVLAGWWVSQRRYQKNGDLTAEQSAALDQVAKLAQDIKDGRRTRRTARGLAQDARDITVFRAREALKSPYLIDGDREVLQLRIKNPTADVGVLADHLGISRTAYQGRLVGALNRKPGSKRRPAEPRAPRYNRKLAAQLVGVDLRGFDEMVKRGLFTHVITRGPRGRREYLRTEVHEARKKLEETVLALADLFEELSPAVPAAPPGRWEVWHRLAPRRPAPDSPGDV
jgi:hypothetical protein